MVNKIERKTVSEAVLEEIKRMIIEGEWKPGSKIPSENELAQMMGVSRVSVRGALQKLSSFGLVESRQGGGTFVCQLDGSQNLNMLVPWIVLSDENQKHMVEFRRIIESEAAYLAALRATETDIDRLWENWRTYREEAQRGDLSEACLQLDVEFHIMIAQLTQNPMFMQILQMLKETVAENIRYAWENAEKSEALDTHKVIIEAIAHHDPSAARKAMWDHMDINWELIKNR